MARRVAIGNHKGGSGKTAATTGFAAALAEQGKRVLVVDLDPQANATRRLGAAYDAEHPVPTTAEVIKDGSDGIAAQAIRPCGWEAPYADRIDVIPARYDLENRISEAGLVGAVLRLRRALAGVDDDYDVTLLDCPPSLGHLTQLGLAAAQYAVCTVEPEYDSVEGAMRYRDFVADEHNREGLSNLSLRLIGYIVCRVRSGVGAHTYQLDGIPETFGADMVWTPYVPERAAQKDAADGELPLRLVTTGAGRQHAALWDDLTKRLLMEVTR
jgi:cellulose biosynthesis protein BcsQ